MDDTSKQNAARTLFRTGKLLKIVTTTILQYGMKDIVVSMRQFRLRS